MMRLVAIFMLVCGNDGVSQESPVRRKNDQKPINCVLWGDARPSGKVSGTTKMYAQLFETQRQAEDQFHIAKKNSDVVIQYKGSFEYKRHVSARMTNSVKWRSLFDWCNHTEHKFEDVSPDKWKPASFFIAPTAPVRKEKKPAVTFSLKQQLEAKDEDEGSAAAYLEDGDKFDNINCVIAADSSSKDRTRLNATIFENSEDAERNFRLSKTSGASLAIQYKGKREYKRHVSPVLTHVPWISLFEWCKKLHADWKAQPTGSYFIKGMIGVPSHRVTESFVRPPQVAATKSIAQQEVDQMAAAASMMETAESVGAFTSKQFVPKSTFEEVQKFMAHGMTRQVMSYQRFPGWDCGVADRSDARMAGVDMSVSACKEVCDKDMQCNGMQYDKSIGACYYASIGHFNEKRCTKSEKYSVYLQTAKWTIDKQVVAKFEGRACAVRVGDKIVGRGGEVLGVEKQVNRMSACRDTCADQQGCTCFKFGRTDQTCVTMQNCDMKECEESQNDDMYIHEAVKMGLKEKPW